jgi:TPR repeat protein
VSPVPLTVAPAVTTAPSVSPEETSAAVANTAATIAPRLSQSLGVSPLANEYNEWKKLAMTTFDNSYLIDHARQRYPEWRRAADQGDPIGQFFVGYSYLHGLTVPVDPVTGFDWLKKSAEQNNSDAMVLVAACSGGGIGTQQNPLEYGRWIKEALDAGSSVAMVTHGIALLLFSPGTADKEEGKKLFFKAADAGNLDCLFWTALVSTGAPAESARRMKKAADGGQPDALFVRAEALKGTAQGKNMVARALKTMGNPLSVAHIIDRTVPFGLDHTNLYPDLT